MGPTPGAPSLPAGAATGVAAWALALGATSSLGKVGEPACGRVGSALLAPGAVSAPGGGLRSQPASVASSSAQARGRTVRGRVLGRGIRGKAFPGFFPQPAGAIHFSVI